MKIATTFMLILLINLSSWAWAEPDPCRPYELRGKMVVLKSGAAILEVYPGTTNKITYPILQLGLRERLKFKNRLVEIKGAQFVLASKSFNLASATVAALIDQDELQKNPIAPLEGNLCTP